MKCSISLGRVLLDMNVPASIKREAYTKIFYSLHGDSIDGIDMLHDVKRARDVDGLSFVLMKFHLPLLRPLLGLV